MINLFLVQCFLIGVLASSLLNSPPAKRIRTTTIRSIFDKPVQSDNPSIPSNNIENDSSAIDVVCFLKEAYDRLQNVKRIYEIDKSLISSSSELVQRHLDNIQSVVVEINGILHPFNELNLKTEPESISDEDSYIHGHFSQSSHKKPITSSCNGNLNNISSNYSRINVQNEPILSNLLWAALPTSSPRCPIFYIGKSFYTEYIKRTFSTSYLYYNASTSFQQNVYLRTDDFNDILFLPYICRVLKYYDFSAANSERKFSEFGGFLYECINLVKKSERPFIYALERGKKSCLSSTFNMDSYMLLTILVHSSKLLTRENVQKFSENIQKIAESFSRLISQDMGLSLSQTIKQSSEVSLMFQRTLSSIAFSDFHILNLLYQQKQNGNPVFKLIWHDILFTSHRYNKTEMSKLFYCQFLIAIDQFILDDSIQIINRLNALFIEFQAFIFNCNICSFNQKYVDKCNSFFVLFQERFIVDENFPSLKQCLESVWKVYSFQYRLYIVKKYSLLNQLKNKGEQYLRDNETVLRSYNLSIFISAFHNVINLTELIQNDKSDENNQNEDNEYSTSSASNHLHSRTFNRTLPTITEAIQMHLYLLDFLNNTINYETIEQIVQSYSHILIDLSDLPTRILYESFFNRIYTTMKENLSMDQLITEFESRRKDFVDICKFFFEKKYLLCLKKNPREFFDYLLDFLILKDLI